MPIVCVGYSRSQPCRLEKSFRVRRTALEVFSNFPHPPPVLPQVDQKRPTVEDWQCSVLGARHLADVELRGHNHSLFHCAVCRCRGSCIAFRSKKVPFHPNTTHTETCPSVCHWCQELTGRGGLPTVSCSMARALPTLPLATSTSACRLSDSSVLVSV